MENGMHKLKTMPELGRMNVEEFKRAEKFPVCVVLDNVRSMHNIGSCFRTCDAFRVEKIFLCGITAVPPHREIEKAALGATLSVDWEYCEDAALAVRRLKESGYTVYAVEQVHGSVALQDLALGERTGRSVQENGSGDPFIYTDREVRAPNLHGPGGPFSVAFVFGNEVEGVQQQVVDLCHGAVEIPQFGTKHSLNVSVSIGIVLWQALQKLLHL